jgi:plasmid stabilization system protein ParE
MDCKISWSKKADNKLDDLKEYLTNENGEITCNKFLNKIIDFLKLLPTYQNFGTLENEKSNIRKYVLIKQVSIIFKIKKNEIIILNLYDNRQDPKNRKY